MSLFKNVDHVSQPMLRHFVRLNEEHNQAGQRRWAATPTWRKILFYTWISGPAIRWNRREPLQKYMRELPQLPPWEKMET